MTRETEKTPLLIDLGAVRTQTHGSTGAPIDEVQGFLGTGLSDD